MTGYRSPPDDYLCAAYSEAFWYDQPEIRNTPRIRLLWRFLTEPRYATVVRFRLEQLARFRLAALDAKHGTLRLPVLLRSAFRDAIRVACLRMFAHWLERSLFYSTGCSLSPYASIAPGLWGVFVNVGITTDARLGPNCYLEANVSISGHLQHAPQLGANVHVHTGAVIMGAVTIGDNAVIGANSVVTRSIPANVTAFGLPAKIVFRRPPPSAAT